METLSLLVLGFESALSFTNLLYCLLGVVVGTAIGVLPGLGPIATISMLLPVTFGLPADASLIMLAGIYYGAQYGGSTTAILVNLPGESSSVVTAIDGYAMARSGKAGLALSTAAIGSFVAGTLATVLIVIAAPTLSDFAMMFGPPEYFSLMVFGLVVSIVLAQSSLLNAFGMILFGILLGLVGSDVNSGATRYTFGIGELYEGIDFVVIAMGVFGIGEIISNLSAEAERSQSAQKVTGILPTRRDLRLMIPPILRGATLGSVMGVLPGGGAMLAAFSSYALEKRVSKEPETFGKGALAGVAGPESANNAAAQTAFIPMLTLGFPGSATMVLMMGALMIQGIQPGPGIIDTQPALVWGLIVSMWIGNLFLLLLNLPLVGIWVRLLGVPYHFLYPAILVFCLIGVYSLSNSAFDIVLLSGFGLLGYVFRRLDAEPAPLLLAFILGPMMEEQLRRTLLLTRGDPLVFLTKPISAALLMMALAFLAMVLIPSLRRSRSEAFQPDE